MSSTEPRKFFPLSKVVSRIDQLLRPAMEKTFWIKGELSSCKSKGEHFFCELVESDDSGAVLAQLRCAIWGSEMRRIRRAFEDQQLELKLSDGMVVGVMCRLQYHPVYGLSLRGLDMDPAMMLGEIELKKRALMEALEKEKLHTLNAQCEHHPLPLKIGLITAEGSAAFYDFTQTLFASPYGFRVQLAAATVQGENCETSVLKALSCCSQLDVDLIVICRGGGSKLDLAWLDTESVARAVATCEKAVWVGIGHEIDRGVLDFVAAKSFKTPTALAEELVARFEAAEQYGQQARHNLTSAWNFKFQAEQAWMKELRGGMQLGVRKLLDGSRSALMAKAEGLRGRVSARLSGAQQSYQKQNFKLEHGVSRVLKDKSYDLKQSQSRLGHGAQGKVSSARQSLSFAKKRCDIDRVEAILNQKREGLQTQNKRLCGGVFEARISVELELLKSKASRLKWADPRQNLKRGYAIVQRKGKSFRSVENIQKGDLVDIQLEHGKMVSRVESIEISQKRTES